MEQHQPCQKNYLRADYRYYPWFGNSAGNGNLHLGQLVCRCFKGRSPYSGILPCYERIVPYGRRPEDEYEVYRCPLPAG